MYDVIKVNNAGIGFSRSILFPHLITTVEAVDDAKSQGLDWARGQDLLRPDHTYDWDEKVPGQTWILRSETHWPGVKIIRIGGTES